VSVIHYVAAVLAFGVGSSAISQELASTAQSTPAAETTESELEEYYRHMSAKSYDLALKVADKFDPGADNPRGTAMVSAMRASALGGLKRDQEARKLIAKADKIAPQEPDVFDVMFYTSLLAGRFDFAADALDKLIARAPDRVRELDRESVWHFFRNEPKDDQARIDNRTIALAQIGYGGERYGDYTAEDAVSILVNRGDFAGAADLIRYIDEPQLIENFLIQRRFEKLWPTVEAQAGPRLEKVRSSSVRSAESAMAENPDDAEALQSLANALRHAGRLDEAIALRSRLLATRENMAKADEHTGWVVNEIAMSLHEAGRADEADQLYALLNEAPIEDDWWLVSMKINRLELLVADGKFDRAWPLVEPTARSKGSPYADQLVRRLRYCTLHGLGRQAEAAKLLPDLLAHAKDAPAPTVDALICSGELDEAEKLVLSSIKDEKFQSDFVRALQVIPLTSDDPSVWQKGWKELRDRPAITAEFNRLGRDMPQEYLPPGR
jgi:tetratricopeptide (TPR) repeat protein